MGKKEKNQKKTIRTTRVCAPASPGSTGAFASMPLLLAMCAIRERVRLPRHTMGGHSRGPVRPGDDWIIKLNKLKCQDVLLSLLTFVEMYEILRVRICSFTKNMLICAIR
nr:MAG TPA: hypothetical protein [Caudoviricetes sp.]